jgi:hypothetical protein
MLLEKDKLKQKMVEYISDQFWLHNKNPTFIEIYEQFKTFLSRGSVSNYLEELVSEKVVVKINKGSNVFYSKPCMHVASKVFIGFIFITIFILLFDMFTFKSFHSLFFCFGCLFTCVLWRFLAQKQP